MPAKARDSCAVYWGTYECLGEGVVRLQRVVVVGGGFGGLAAARRLGRWPLEVVLVDRRNHHLFQPLLYQVATAVLSPEEIAMPIRSLFRGRGRVQVVLEEVVGVDLPGRRLVLRQGFLPYDYCILAPGSVNGYFGHEAWAREAPGLKSLEDALAIRRRILTAFEYAEQAKTREERQAYLTFVVIGGGPTGVELAGALAEIALLTLRHDFREIHPEDARIILVEGGERLLRSFPPELSRYAERVLRRLGVTVRLGTVVRQIGDGFVDVGTEERIWTRTVLWAAGVKAAPLVAELPVPRDASGRVLVEPDLSLPGHEEVFVVGDAAHVAVEGAVLPAVAPVAMQEGWAAAENVWRRSRGLPTRPFRYQDKGSLATIGRSRAVAQLGRLRVKGSVAWLLWLFVHILYLAGFENRLIVLIRWAWAYLVYQRGARLVYGVAGEDGCRSPARAPEGHRS